jgi:hypothetical protein
MALTELPLGCGSAWRTNEQIARHILLEADRDYEPRQCSPREHADRAAMVPNPRLT